MDSAASTVSKREHTDYKVGDINDRNEYAWKQFDRDQRTNLASFSAWLHAYLVSPGRDLSKEGERQLLYLIKRRRHDLDYSAIRLVREMSSDARKVLSMWEYEPIEKDTVEWRAARVRMVRDMMVEGMLEAFEAKGGLQITDDEKARAARQIWDEPGHGKKTCQMDLNRPKLKELKWMLASIVCNDATQTVVDICDTVPHWKLEYEAYLEAAKQKKQLKQAEMLEVKKAKGKSKHQTLKARHREAAAVGASLPQIGHNTTETPDSDGGCNIRANMEGDAEEGLNVSGLMDELEPIANTTSDLEVSLSSVGGSGQDTAIDLPFRTRKLGGEGSG